MEQHREQTPNTTLEEILEQDYEGQVDNNGKYVVTCASLSESGEVIPGGGAVAFFNESELAAKCVRKIREENPNLNPRFTENK